MLIKNNKYRHVHRSSIIDRSGTVSNSNDSSDGENHIVPKNSVHSNVDNNDDDDSSNNSGGGNVYRAVLRMVRKCISYVYPSPFIVWSMIIPITMGILYTHRYYIINHN